MVNQGLTLCKATLADELNTTLFFFIHSHVRRSLSPSDELRVDTKTADQTCCLYGLDMVSETS